MKYTPPDGCVEVTGHSDEDEVVMSISNTGIGIPENNLARHLRALFYRVDKARSKETGGTGLGLRSIVRHIAENHGGRVTVESTLGEGSIFTVYLPSG